MTKNSNNETAVYEIRELLNFGSSDHVYLTYKNRAENSDKFYELYLTPDGSRPNLFSVVARWGRNGTSGQKQVKYSGQKSACLSFMDSTAREKMAKGYVKISR